MFAEYYYRDKMKEGDVGEACDKWGEKRNA
jgi:hypothetical protein